MDDVSTADYQALAEFRYQIRRFLHFSKEQASRSGIEPQQHQLLLAIRGLPTGHKPTIVELASRLQLKHHSVVELINRLESRGAVKRSPCDKDRRQVLINVTASGEMLLRELSILHRQEVENSGPMLAKALRRVMQRARIAAASSA